MTDHSPPVASSVTYRVSQITDNPQNGLISAIEELFYTSIFTGFCYRVHNWLPFIYLMCLLCEDNQCSMIVRTIDNAQECMIISFLNEH